MLKDAHKKSASATGAGGDANATIRQRLGMSGEEFRELGAIGAMFYEQGSLEKAQTIFEGLVELDPDNAHAQSALGALYTRIQQDEKALLHLNRAIELDQNQIAPYVNRAEVYIRRQELEKSVADLKRAIELDPHEKDPGANRARAIVLGIHDALEAKGVM